MSYDSPIRIIERNMTEKLEDNLMSVIKSYGIDVNRAELLRDLNYDRKRKNTCARQDGWKGE